MSTPVGDASTSKKGLGKYVARMKSVLKKPDGSKRLSFVSKPATEPASIGEATSTIAPDATEVVAAKATSNTSPAKHLVEATENALGKVAPSTKPVNKSPPGDTESAAPLTILRSDLEAARAARLAARFKIDILPADWVITLTEEGKEAYRVEKPVRMRIHRTCHKCSVTFGTNKTCTGCQHVRCTKCPRYPTKGENGASKSKPRPLLVNDAVLEALEVDHHRRDIYGIHECEPPLTIPRKTGGQPLVRRKQLQRVRRNCCECGTLYVQNIKVCASCTHVRCSDCPRDPAKKKKYPYGYPGDVPSARTRHFACHVCTKVFGIADTHTLLDAIAGETAVLPSCERCQHVKCERCPRATPRKIEPEPDPAILKSLQEKLEEMRISGAAVAA